MTDYEARRIPGDGEIEEAFDVRRDVFIEEQGVSEAEEWDGHDEASVHFVVYDDEYPVGTARLRTPVDEVAKAERVAVRKSYRGEGIGRQLMDLLESEAHDQGCSQVRLHAQTAVEGFYQRLGYKTTSDEFLEANIPHVVMERPLD